MVTNPTAAFEKEFLRKQSFPSGDYPGILVPWGTPSSIIPSLTDETNSEILEATLAVAKFVIKAWVNLQAASIHITSLETFPEFSWESLWLELTSRC